MIQTLIRKDLGLLKQYVVGAIAVTIVCYMATAIGVVWLTDYQDESMQSLPVRIFLILRGGHNLGFCATALLSVMLAGSIFTLERADRSAEFLACLPPRRYQHLISKFAVLFGTTAFMVIVHVSMTLISDLLRACNNLSFHRWDSAILGPHVHRNSDVDDRRSVSRFSMAKLEWLSHPVRLVNAYRVGGSH